LLVVDIFYKDQKQYYIAIDCIIFGFDKWNLKLLLIKRNFKPYKGKWSLMGGFLRPDESLGQAAHRILFQLTGLKDIFLDQLHTYSEIDRDPAGRVVSVAYFALIDAKKFSETRLKKKFTNANEENVRPEGSGTNEHEIKNKSYTARWFDINAAPKLIFDHGQMVVDALKRLKEKSMTHPIGFELLPEKFTVPQLQKLYEAINQVEFDKRNFRKKILSFHILKRLEEKDKEGSKKGAYLYTIDKEKYDQMLKDGLFFII
jgi:8-oxo-dGTP diphosphatase